MRVRIVLKQLMNIVTDTHIAVGIRLLKRVIVIQDGKVKIVRHVPKVDKDAAVTVVGTSTRISAGVSPGGRVLIVTQLHVADMAILTMAIAIATACHAKTVMAVLSAKQKTCVIVAMVYGSTILTEEVIVTAQTVMAERSVKQLMRNTIYATIMVLLGKI